MLSRARSLLGLASSIAVAACGHDGHPPFASAGVVVGGRARDAGSDANLLHVGPPPLPPDDAPGVCGRTIVPIAAKPVNLYFILDASGSMATPIDSPDTNGGFEISRYDAARSAISDVLLAVGSRVSYGAAVFPGPVSQDSPDVCPPGTEVYSTTKGDPVSDSASGEPGPKLKLLLQILGARAPSGLTPTAASIAAVKSNLVALEGETYAILLTDGAPNCNAQASCSAATCTVNIEASCGEPSYVNCCNPALGLYDDRWCLDADPTVAAVKDLADAGVKTFVIGMPGTATAYTDLLSRVAEAGGTGRPGDAGASSGASAGDAGADDFGYYLAGDASKLSAHLQRIGRSVAIRCDVTLMEAPPSRDLVNVYFDQAVVPFDEKNGWTWTSDTSISVVGASCSQLESGSVRQLQVVAGCPSVTR
ncbi:MAG TPA: hypothetical protein VHC69_10400 [Polyangiaceae bacterium]|nr:hypothetical protein [Polyangiaceae bacterium]